MLILVLAANTSYADFPRLASILARDGFAPTQFTHRGDRLGFSNGIIVLTLFAMALVVIFGGNVFRLIPLYAIGVFLSFTLSQGGMVRRWQKVGTLMRRGELTPGKEITTLGSVLQFDRGWRPKQLLNGVGAIITAIVTVVFLVSKFTQGAWITAILIPSLVWLFFRIHRHYRYVAHVLSTANPNVRPHKRTMHTVVLVADVDRETVRLVEFAQSLGCSWVAVHVAVQEDKVAKIQRKWQERIGQGKLIILPSPYRSISLPIRDYVSGMLKQYPNDFVQVVLGKLIAMLVVTALVGRHVGERLGPAEELRLAFALLGEDGVARRRQDGPAADEEESGGGGFGAATDGVEAANGNSTRGSPKSTGGGTNTATGGATNTPTTTRAGRRASRAVPIRVQWRPSAESYPVSVSPERSSRSQRGAAADTGPDRPAVSWV